MTKLHPNNGNQIATGPFPRALPATKASERCSIESDRECVQSPNSSSHLDWTMIAVWGFVVFSFAALFFCFWAIAARCNGGWPF
jgi:hypothetical protein